MFHKLQQGQRTHLRHNDLMRFGKKLLSYRGLQQRQSCCSLGSIGVELRSLYLMPECDRNSLQLVASSKAASARLIEIFF
ncbi:MAG TPA: hypothetical protein V6C85_08760 [Allocoleopsis sp.]